MDLLVLHLNLVSVNIKFPILAFVVTEMCFSQKFSIYVQEFVCINFLFLKSVTGIR